MLFINVTVGQRSIFSLDHFATTQTHTHTHTHRHTHSPAAQQYSWCAKSIADKGLLQPKKGKIHSPSSSFMKFLLLHFENALVATESLTTLVSDVISST